MIGFPVFIFGLPKKLIIPGLQIILKSNILILRSAIQVYLGLKKGKIFKSSTLVGIQFLV
jgi:hypothetical protein